MEKESINQKTTFNFKKFVTLCFKSWRVFVISVLACAILAGLFSIVKPPKDEVLAQIMLKDDSGSSSMLMAGQIARSFSLGDMFGGSSTTDNESFVLRSHTIFKQTVEQMGLNTSYYARRLVVLSDPVYSKIPYRLVAPGGASDTISKTLIFDIKRQDDGKFDIRAKVKRKVLAQLKGQSLPATVETDYGKYIIEKTEYYTDETPAKYRITFSSYDGAASAYEKLVNIYVPDRKSDFIDLSFVTSDAAFGKMLLARIISNYEKLSNVYKADRSNESLRLVDDRLASLAQELVHSENALEQFKKANNITDVEADAQYLMTKTGALESSLLQAQTNYEVVKMTKDFITNPKNNYSLIPDLFMASGTTGADNSGGLIAQYNQLILQRMELASSAKGNNANIKQLDEQIDAMRENIITSVDRLYQNASLALSDLKGENTKNKSRLSELPTIEKQYIVLKRDNLLQEQIYLFLLQQREELNMSLASRAFPVQVIDAPYVLPDPAGLTRKVALALGVLLGLVAGALYVFFVKMRHCPITSRQEVDGALKAPAMQALGVDADGLEASAFAADRANAEALRHLRSDVQFALKSCDGKVVVVTSVHDAEGKTYVAVNLAESLAMIGKKVVLVDAALRAPAVAKTLGINENSPLLTDYVRSSGSDIRVTPVNVGDGYTLDVVASKSEEPNSADIVASERFATLIDTLRMRYDYVVIDSSRIDGYSDIYYLTDVADLTLVVCRSKVVTSHDIDRINALYTDGRLKRIAVVTNAFK